MRPMLSRYILSMFYRNLYFGGWKMDVKFQQASSGFCTLMMAQVGLLIAGQQVSLEMMGYDVTMHRLAVEHAMGTMI